MKSIKTKEKTQESKSWILPGKSLSHEEFSEGIQIAEKGPFHTVQESMENFEIWLKSRKKK
ncbi:MAG: hypothetical protein Q7U54_05270 [Bacteroidales bacterium]|nr:hypothetical protein [Bacteroidales bacterium]